MWIPTPFYERAPQFWLLLGFLLIIVGIYLGMQVSAWFLYTGAICGAGCIVWSVLIFSRRGRKRPVEIVDPDLDQTCELNYRPD